MITTATEAKRLAEGLEKRFEAYLCHASGLGGAVLEAERQGLDLTREFRVSLYPEQDYAEFFQVPVMTPNEMWAVTPAQVL